MSAITRGQDSLSLALAFGALRARLLLMGALMALVALGWWWTFTAMDGMNGGPWTPLGSFGFFIIMWTVMMYVMMFPAIAPTVALYARMTKARAPLQPLMFTMGYLSVWVGAGLIAFAVGKLAPTVFGNAFAWQYAGRYVTAGTLLAAALYQLTSLKQACLNKCRTPLAFLLGAWRDGKRGALQMGAKNGAWCLGCCWVIMAALFALGVMSLTWMAILAAVVTAEKLLPWRGFASGVTTSLLAALGLLVLFVPDAVPVLAIPVHGNMVAMPGM